MEEPSGAVHGVARSRTRLSDFTFPFHFGALEKEMATHSTILAWRIPGTEEPSGLPSMGSHRVGPKRIYSNVKVVLSNSDIQNYTIKIGNKTYNKGDKISIPQGTYTVVINALGYNTWTKNITFTKGDYTIKATLQSEKSEEEETTTTDNTVSTPTQDKNEVATGDTKTINIATDPAGATAVWVSRIQDSCRESVLTPALPVWNFSLLGRHILTISRFLNLVSEKGRIVSRVA